MRSHRFLRHLPWFLRWYQPNLTIHSLKRNLPYRSRSCLYNLKYKFLLKNGVNYGRRKNTVECSVSLLDVTTLELIKYSFKKTLLMPLEYQCLAQIVLEERLLISCWCLFNLFKIKLRVNNFNAIIKEIFKKYKNMNFVKNEKL